MGFKEELTSALSKADKLAESTVAAIARSPLGPTQDTVVRGLNKYYAQPVRSAWDWLNKKIDTTAGTAKTNFQRNIGMQSEQDAAKEDIINKYYR